MSIQLHSELPIQAINDDLLGRASLVEMIANAILAKAQKEHECYTIGIYGKWGEGKTSVLNMLKAYLLSHEDDNILVATFNPWVLKNQESMLMEFFNVLVQESIFKRSVDKIKEYAVAISLGVGAVSNVIVPASGATAAQIAKGVIDALPSFQQTIQQRKSDISKVIKKSKKHLLVLIDDVDRLDNAETHALLKLIRQVADFDNVIYVIAMDADIVSKSISQNFGAGTYDDGRRFLDKIVQVPVVLPQIEDRTLQRIFLHKLAYLFTTTSPSISASIAEEIAEKIGNLFSSVREIYRYINQLSFVLPSLHKEVNIVDLCMLEVVKLFNIQGYNFIYENRNLVLRKHFALESALIPDEELEKEDDKKMDDLIRKIGTGLPEGVRLPLEYVLKHELLYKQLLPNPMQLMEHKRLCSDIYFDKYFMQCVPSNIIPDTFLDKHLDDIISKEVKWLTQMLNDLFEKYSLDEVKRAAVYWISKSGTDLKIQSQRAVKVCKALALMDINKTCGYNFINKYGLDIYIARVLMPMYMLSQSEDINHSSEYDEDNIFETCRYIVQNSCVRFSMIFFYQIRHSRLWRNTDNLITMFTILREKLFTQFDKFEIFGYSKNIQRAFFEAWKAEDKTEFMSFITTTIQNSDFPIVKFISCHIDDTRDGSSYISFLRLFECKDTIASRLKAMITEEDMKNPSIALFCENCNDLIDK